MKTIEKLIAAAFLVSSPLAAMAQTEEPVTNAIVPAAPTAKEANIQLAILLDTSGSMNGLLEQARTRIWKIINTMSLAKQNGKLPNIEIALYEYGLANSENDYTRLIIPFTDDLDAISEALFALKTTGSQEYCGKVIQRATEELKWNETDSNALKMIFIAGNEPFNQGEVEPISAIKEALEKGITVNTIYCGDDNVTETEGWKAGAAKGDGSFFCINHNTATADPETPFDKELAELGSNINKTYIAYGAPAAQALAKDRQAAQDNNAIQVSGSVMAERSLFKGGGSSSYDNKSWDIIDALGSDIGSAEPEEMLKSLESKNMLPDEFNGKTLEEQKKIIEKKKAERAEIQQKIGDLAKKRNAWLDENKKPSATELSLDEAIIKSVKKQAIDKQFSFEEK